MNFLTAKKLFLLSFLALTVILSAQDDPNYNRYLLSKNFSQQGDHPKAIAILEDLAKSFPDNPVYIHDLNEEYVATKTYSKSLQLLFPKFIRNAQDFSLAALIGKSLYLNKEENRAFIFWDSLLSATNSKAFPARIFAGVCLELRIIEKAVHFLNIAKDNSGNNPTYSMELLTLYLQTMQYKESISETIALVSSYPQQIPQVEARIFPFYNRPEFLKPLIDAIELKIFSTPDKKRFYFKLLLEDKRYDDAFAVCKSLDHDLNRQGDELYLFGLQLFTAKQFDAAEKTFQFILEQFPNSVYGPLAKLYLLKTLDAKISLKFENTSANWQPIKIKKIYPIAEYTNIIKRYSDLIAVNPQSETALDAKLRLAHIYANANSFDTAKMYLFNIFKYNGMSPIAAESYWLLNSIYLLSGKMDSSAYYLNRINESPYASLIQKNAAKIQKAKLLICNDSLEAARTMLASISVNPKDDFANDAIELSLMLNTEFNDSLSIKGYTYTLLLCDAGNLHKADSIISALKPDPKFFYLYSLAELKKLEIKSALAKFNEVKDIIFAINNEKSNIFIDKINLLLGKVYLFGLSQPAEAKKVFETFLADYPSSIYLNEVRELLKQ